MHIVHIEGKSPLRDVLQIALDAAEPDLVLAQFISGDEAVPYIQAHAAEIDLFIVDVCLPGYLSGLQLAFFIRAMQCPGTIVLTSGYGSPNQNALNALHSEFIPKPYHIPELTQNLAKYHIKQSSNELKPRLDVPTDSLSNDQANTRPTDIQSPASQQTRRFVLGRKVATGEHKKVVAGSGLLQKLISKVRSL